MPQPPVDLTDVRNAATRIADYAYRTPVITSHALDDLADRRLFFKCENFQRVGAFKFRGACNALLQLNQRDLEAGVITHSSGNHAQALSLAAKLIGTPAFIVMPFTAPLVKRVAVEGYGGQVFECEPNLASRESTATRIQSDTGSYFIPPFDHPHIIAGQGTAALELIDEVDNLDAIIAPVGGGGLISGVCAAACFREKPIRVFAAEPAGADDAARSKSLGELQPSVDPKTIADGLLTSMGEYTWPYVRDYVEEVLTVSEEQIISAMRFFWERTKAIIEPSSAVAVAVALSDEFHAKPGIRRVGVILSGGNVDLEHLPWQVED